MTKVTISGNANGTGNVNFAAPNTNSTITVTLPTSNVDMDSLGPSTTLADVGTYALMRTGPNYGSTAAGTVFSASYGQFIYADVYGNGSGGPGAGSWRSMGYSDSSDRPTVWVRIS